MAAAKLSDEAFSAILEAHPGLRERFESIAMAVANSGENLKEADAIEERIVEEMRLLGREAMQGWAETQVKATEKEIRQQPSMHRQGKKNSAGIRNLAKSRFLSRNIGARRSAFAHSCAAQKLSLGGVHGRGTTFALRMNGRTRFVSLRYCGSKTSISPNFVCQRSFFYLGDASKVVDEFLSRSLSPGSRPILASPLAPTAAFPRQSALRSPRPP